MDTLEYVTVWNGSHCGDDADLLRRDLAVPEKCDGALIPSRPPRHPTLCVEVIEEALRAHPRQTLSELAQRLEAPMELVQGHLYRLQAKGRLGSTYAVRRQGTNGRPAREYWLIEGGQA